MASWPHWRQRSRWPPSAAVRQCSMAKSTRRCSQVSQDRFFSMKLLPCARMISATSKGGRVHLLCSLRDRFTWSGLDSSMLSSGVPAALRWRSDRCR